MTATTQAFFLPVAGAAARPRFCMHHAPASGPARALVVYVHPFAEEMNKARRTVAVQARALAASGFAVLQIDLLGCGDSAGGFDEADWSLWVEDVVAACRWLVERHTAPRAPAPPLWLWGLRVGCLLAAAAAQRASLDCNFLFWQPVVSGAPALQQFLRLKTARDLAAVAGRTTTQALRQQLSCGQAVEVAGYRLAPGLAAGLDAARLVPPAGAATARVVWIETSTREPAQLLPASGAAIGLWQAAGHDVRAQAVAGPAFWQTVEIEEAPALVAASIQALCGGGAAPPPGHPRAGTPVCA